MKKTVQVALLVVSLCFLSETNAKLMKVIQREEEFKLTGESLGFNHIPEKPLPSQQNVEETEKCPPLMCADPEHGTGSCPNCDNSRCKFRGCVHFGAFGPQWMPDPCTICSCTNNEELCTKIECEENLECYGYPSSVKEGDCCPSCDFGVPENECGVVPKGYKSLYTALGDEACQKDVLLHGCNKEFIQGNDGKIYKCTPVEALYTHDIDQKCCKNGINQVSYMDTQSCVKEEISPSELPMDLDLTPKSCAIYVSP